MQFAVLWLAKGSEFLPDMDNVGTMDIVRDTLPALKNSALKDFTFIIDDLGLNKAIQYQRTG